MFNHHNIIGMERLVIWALNTMVGGSKIISAFYNEPKDHEVTFFKQITYLIFSTCFPIDHSFQL
jgi:hypothetical protein